LDPIWDTVRPRFSGKIAPVNKLEARIGGISPPIAAFVPLGHGRDRMLERRQLQLGKYDIVAQPASGSMHMLRYTVLLNAKRLGALLSVPDRVGLQILEAPPKSALKIFSVTFRPGRPRKDASVRMAPRAASPGPSSPGPSRDSSATRLP